jgi:branched-chain amino acid transport system permease protein
LFLLAAGLSITFGLMNIINLAHGSFFMFGAYVGYAAWKVTDNWFIAIVAGAIALGLIGATIQRFFLRRFYRRYLEQVLLTFGFIYIFMDISKWIWGGDPLTINKPSLLDFSIDFMDGSYPVYRLAVIGIGIAVAAALFIFQARTQMGARIRAGVDDREMASAMGVNIGLVFTLVFALGAFVAAFGGVVGAPIIGIYPGLDFHILLLALIVVVVGGLGTLQGALVGSLLIGMVDSFGKALFPEYAMYTIFGVAALVLVFWPTGLLGRKEHS